MNVAAQLTRALQRAGIPVSGVRIGADADRRTWQIFYDDAATDAQMTAGEAIRQTYDPATDAVYTQEQRDAEIDGLKALRALAEATFELKSNAWTKAQFLGRVKTIYRDLER